MFGSLSNLMSNSSRKQQQCADEIFHCVYLELHIKCPGLGLNENEENGAQETHCYLTVYNKEYLLRLYL